MRSLSSALSISIHVAAAAAFVLGAKTGRSNPSRPEPFPMVLPSEVPDRGAGVGDGGRFALPGPIQVAPPDVSGLSISSQLPSGASLSLPLQGSMPSPGQPGNGSSLFEQYAELLSSPLPVYPDLLRQAGVQGRVLLEGVVDTTGRIMPESVLVVSATNPGFIGPARQAFLASLFRPARSGGRAVEMRVRVPYDFTIRTGMGHAR